MKTLTKIAVTMIAAAGMSFSAHALTMTLGGPLPGLREASLADATAGFTGTGNATVADVNAGFLGLAPWTERGEVTAGGASDPIFSVSLTSGSWGSAPAAGTWTINDPNFWTTYANGAISMHVGNGGGNPDHFVWLLEVGALTGTWSYDNGNTSGGGLSNLKLYSSGTGTSVPDGGSTLALFGLAVAGLGFLRRKLS